MKKSFILVVSILAVAFFTGCEDTGVGTKTSDTLNVICDKRKNVEYMGFRSGSGGGLSVRYNIDGTISTCGNSK